jgi:hypothetical protein
MLHSSSMSGRFYDQVGDNGVIYDPRTPPTPQAQLHDQMRVYDAIHKLDMDYAEKVSGASNTKNIDWTIVPRNESASGLSQSDIDRFHDAAWADVVRKRFLGADASAGVTSNPQTMGRQMLGIIQTLNLEMRSIVIYGLNLRVEAAEIQLIQRLMSDGFLHPAWDIEATVMRLRRQHRLRYPFAMAVGAQTCCNNALAVGSGESQYSRDLQYAFRDVNYRELTKALKRMTDFELQTELEAVDPTNYIKHLSHIRILRPQTQLPPPSSRGGYDGGGLIIQQQMGGGNIPVPAAPAVAPVAPHPPPLPAPPLRPAVHPPQVIPAGVIMPPPPPAIPFVPPLPAAIPAPPHPPAPDLAADFQRIEDTIAAETLAIRTLIIATRADLVDTVLPNGANNLYDRINTRMTRLSALTNARVVNEGARITRTLNAEFENQAAFITAEVNRATNDITNHFDAAMAAQNAHFTAMINTLDTNLQEFRNESHMVMNRHSEQMAAAFGRAETNFTVLHAEVQHISGVVDAIAANTTNLVAQVTEIRANVQEIRINYMTRDELDGQFNLIGNRFTHLDEQHARVVNDLTGMSTMFDRNIEILEMLAESVYPEELLGIIEAIRLGMDNHMEAVNASIGVLRENMHDTQTNVVLLSRNLRASDERMAVFVREFGANLGASILRVIQERM